MDKVAIIDFGGQYAHLIGSRVRRLGVYSEIWSPDLDEYDKMSEEERSLFKGVILSGGPQSVYDDNSPRVDRRVYELGLPVLGICYGHQLMMHDLGGKVEKSDTREYGPADIEPEAPSALFKFEKKAPWRVYMSHSDHVASLPAGFKKVASSRSCEYAAVECNEPGRHLVGVQFHPEVHHSEIGNDFFNHFLDTCGLERSWSLKAFLEHEKAELKKSVGDRRVFLLVSGGVDSTVAYLLLAGALGADRIYAMLVDTGFMRKNEIEEVKSALDAAGLPLNVYDARQMYYDALKEVYEPEKKRRIIGKLFIDIQARVSADLKLDPENWMLGQGTIYPDTIESGGTRHAALIKTHHNRVPEVEELIRQGRVVEPLRQLYKDEVRQLGLELGLPAHLIHRQPFPGPGLAVRILNVSPEEADASNTPETQAALLALNQAAAGVIRESPGEEFFGELDVPPLKSVGVKGDDRVYEHPLVVYPSFDFNNWDWQSIDTAGVEVTNRVDGINRVLVSLWRNSGGRHQLLPGYCDADRAALLQDADAIVNKFQEEHGLYDDIWQFPVCLLPLVTDEGDTRGGLVLRPVMSTDAMTVSFYPMEAALLKELVEHLRALPWVSEIFYDVTHKPPGTIEWE